MLKALAGTTLFLGISQKNVDLLEVDRPIKVNFKQMGITVEVTDVVIFYGKTEQELYEQMKPMINPLKTKFNSDQAEHN